MPKAAVDRGFALRPIDPGRSEPAQIYAIASWLGVGYCSLIEHLCFSLNSIPHEHREELRRVRLASLRTALAGRPVRNIVIVDEHWEGRPIDLHVGGVLLMPRGWRLECSCLALGGATVPDLCQHGVLAQAVRQGQGQLLDSLGGRSWPVRVSRQGYAGRSIFRHLDDPDEELATEGFTSERPTHRDVPFSG